MADIAIPAHTAAHTVLTPDVITTIRFPQQVNELQVIAHDGSAPITYTVDGSTPHANSRSRYLLPAGVIRADQRHPPTGPTTVHLLSPGSPAVSVVVLTEAGSAQATAVAAVAAAANARQMVLTRDPRFAELAALTEKLAATASTLASALTTADQTHTALADATRSVADRVTTLEAMRLRGTTGQRVITMPASVATNSTATAAITYATPMPNADHLLLIELASSNTGQLGTLTVVQPPTKTTTGCTVTIRNTAPIALPTTVTVTATALAFA